MIDRITQCLRSAKNSIKEALQTHNYFESQEDKQYTPEQTIWALRFVIGSHATDYQNVMQSYQTLKIVSRYLLSRQKIQQAEELLTLEEDALFASSKYALFMYKNYLEEVMPANVAFYHFIRQKKYYAHFVIIRYIIIVGLANQQQNVLLKLKNSYRLQLFRLLLDWLLELIHYRCSAIYLDSSCVGPLINQIYILLSSMLGYDGHSQILSSLMPQQVNGIYNKLLYISGFILTMAVPIKDSLTINTVLLVLRKLITSIPPQKVVQYLPSYLFARQIGFLHTPFCHEVIFKLLLNFIIKLHQERNKGSQQLLIDNEQSIKTLSLDIWSVISLLVEEYPGIDKQKLKQFVNITLPKLEAKSMIRAFLLKAAFNEHLDLEDQNISKYLSKNKQPYLFKDKIIPIQTFCKNYRIVMNKQYLNILREAARGRMLKLQQSLIWSSIVLYNKYEIVSRSQYLERKNSSPLPSLNSVNNDLQSHN